MRRIAAGVAAVAAVVAVTGCGSSNANGGSESHTVRAAPAVSAKEWKSVITDSYDGLIDHPHSCAAFRAAVAHLPRDKTYESGLMKDIRSYERLVCSLPHGATPSASTVVPSNHGRTLDDALRRLHQAGLRATFPAASPPCGDGFPGINVQSPRAPARVQRGSTVQIRFSHSPVPSPAVPKHHREYAFVPNLVGLEAQTALRKLTAMWPCIHVRAATATASTLLVVVRQAPPAGSRVPAFGVMVGRGYRPTTVDITLAAR